MKIEVGKTLDTVIFVVPVPPQNDATQDEIDQFLDDYNMLRNYKPVQIDRSPKNWLEGKRTVTIDFSQFYKR